MHLRSLSYIVLTAALFSLTCLQFKVEAQTARRRPLASRSLPYRLTVKRYHGAPANLNSPRPVAGRRQATRPARTAAPTTGRTATGNIALGTYFWQNGQCAPGDNGAVEAWRARTGRMPAVWVIFQGWTGWNQFPVAQATRARELGGQLMVTWEPWSGNGNTGDPGWSCASIASGARDGYIRQYARAVRSAQVPVMVRLAHEMNGDWYPWGTAHTSYFARHNGNSPQNYVAMWRRVVSLFRAEGATNARWVWAPNIHYLNKYNSIQSQNSDLFALYPGDSYVDWIGLSVYNDGARRSWNSFTTLFDGAYQAVTHISGKPLMIAEMGATESGAPYGTSKAQWIEQTLTRDIPHRYPRVKLVNWFCRDKTNLGEANYRFDTSAASLRAFRYAANSPLYSARLR